MALTTAQLEAHFGIMYPFMQAYSRADEPTRQACFVAQESYSAGYITAATFQARLNSLLGVQLG